jgi:predicted nucleic acid-binding protein
VGRGGSEGASGGQVDAPTSKAVFDTVILLQAVTNPDGPSWAALARADSGRIQVVASDATLEEAEDVLARPLVRKRFATLDDRRASEFLAVYRGMAAIHVHVPRTVSLERNHKDEPFLDLAVEEDVPLAVEKGGGSAFPPFSRNGKLGSSRLPTNRIRSAKPGWACVFARLPDRSERPEVR